jgi:hypothetical protein
VDSIIADRFLLVITKDLDPGPFCPREENVAGKTFYIHAMKYLGLDLIKLTDKALLIFFSKKVWVNGFAY